MTSPATAALRAVWSASPSDTTMSPPEGGGAEGGTARVLAGRATTTGAPSSGSVQVTCTS
jgi:hypothetical protein